MECTCGEGACELCDGRGMQKSTLIPGDPSVRWKRDDIQFPRLLAEVAGVITQNQIEDLSLSMDLDPQLIMELFDRAEATWEEIKRRT